MTAKIEYTEWVEARENESIIGLTKGKKYGVIGYGNKIKGTVFIIDNKGQVGEYDLNYFKKKDNIDNVVTYNNMIRKIVEIIDFINKNIECKN